MCAYGGVHVCMFLHVFVCVYMHTCVGTCEDPKRALYLLELKLVVYVSHLAWMLGSKF